MATGYNEFAYEDSNEQKDLHTPGKLTQREKGDEYEQHAGNGFPNSVAPQSHPLGVDRKTKKITKSNNVFPQASSHRSSNNKPAVDKISRASVYGISTKPVNTRRRKIVVAGFSVVALLAVIIIAVAVSVSTKTNGATPTEFTTTATLQNGTTQAPTLTTVATTGNDPFESNNEENDFLIAFLWNYDHTFHSSCSQEPLHLSITAQENVTFTMFDSYTGDNITEILMMGNTWTSVYSKSYVHSSSNTVLDGNIIFLSSSGKVNVYVECLCPRTSYGIKYWPLSEDSNHYISFATTAGFGHETVIVANEDDTIVQISSNSFDAFSITLNRYQLYAYIPSSYPKSIEISSSKPVLAINSYECVSLDRDTCDAACAQLHPVSDFQLSYILPTFIPGLDTVFTVIASVDNTQVTLTSTQGTQTVQINKLEHFTPNPTADAHLITCSSPCTVHTFLVGRIGNYDFDPALTFLTEPLSCISETIYFSYKIDSYLVLVAHDDTIASVRVNNQAIASAWVVIPGGSYKSTYLALVDETITNVLSYTGTINAYIVSKGIDNFEGLLRPIC